MDNWLEEAGVPRGSVGTVQQFFDLSVDWYSGRADEDWAPMTPTEAAAVFAKHGLVGPFWDLL